MGVMAMIVEKDYWQILKPE